VLVAIFAVFVASRLERRLGVARTLYLNLTLFAIDVLVIALYTTNRTVLIVAVIVSGAFIGINNTVTTQAVMTVAPVERPVASAAYGFIRFIGAGLAPYVAGRLAAAYNVHLPFYVGAGVVVVGIVILSTGHRLLNTAASGHQPPSAPQAQPATAATGQTSTSQTSTSQTSTSQTSTSQTSTSQTSAAQTAPGWVLLAIDGGPGSATVTSRAAAVAANRGVGVEVMHVQETDVVDTEAIELESAEQAERIVHDRLAQLGELGIPASSYLVTSTGDHGDVGRLIARRARDIRAGLVVVGAPAGRGALLAGADALATAQLASETPCDLLVVPPSPVMTSALPSANAAASAG
jgi:nucleotide-binding universal stress UspA family protein